jgi:hypothetical protein
VKHIEKRGVEGEENLTEQYITEQNRTEQKKNRTKKAEEDRTEKKYLLSSLKCVSRSRAGRRRYE